ncbi:MAG: LysM peptidoglycan-binding domain-containing protein, partial [Myxococcota bacterium]
MNRVAIQLALAVGLLATGRTAFAAELTHRVGKDESLETVAKNYYGAAWKAVYLRQHTGIAATTRAISGQRIKIPSSWIYKVRRGDSAAAIAKRLFNDPNRHKAIMLFNGIKDPASLAVGQELLMQFHLFHTVQPGGSYSQISRRYYRTIKYAGMLKEYNAADMLKPGQKLVIPIFDRSTLEAKNRKYVARSANSAAKPKPPPARLGGAEAQKLLAKAISLYGHGNFDEGCGKLDLLLMQPPPNKKDQLRLYRYLGFCAIAHGDENAARDYFRKWIELDSAASLNPISTSPKILEVFHDVANETRPNAGHVDAADGAKK